MRIRMMLGVSLLSATTAVAEVPSLNVQATCRATPAINTDDKTAYDNCMRSENAARDRLSETWHKVRAQWRTSCLTMTKLGGIPSYVELLTCVEMREAAANPDGVSRHSSTETGSGSQTVNSANSGGLTKGTGARRASGSGPAARPRNPGDPTGGAVLGSGAGPGPTPLLPQLPGRGRQAQRRSGVQVAPQERRTNP